MARLPDTYDVRQAPRGGRAVASFNGTQVADALGDMGRTINSIAANYDKDQEAKQREVDASAVFEARRKLDAWERENVFAPETGAINRLGKNAAGVGDALAKGLDDFSGKVGAELGSERQRKAFQELTASRKAQVLDWAARHEGKQRDIYEAGQYEADIASMADRAALFPDKAAGELSLQATRTIGFMRGKGLSEEEIQAKIKDDASKTHLGVVAAMVNGGNAVEAESYLQKNIAAMTAAASLRAQSMVKEVSARQKAEAAVDDVIDNELAPSVALDVLRERFKSDPVARDAAVNSYKTRETEKQTLLTRQKKEAGDQAWKVITNGGSRKQIPAALWDQLDGEEQRQINDYTEAKWRRAKADAEGKGNDDTPDRLRTYIGLMDMAANEPDKFAELDLARYAPNLTKGHMYRLVTARASINKAGAKEANVARLTQSTVRFLDTSLASAGIKLTGKRSEKEIATADAFKSRLIDELSARAASGKLDEMSARDVGLGLLKEGIEQGTDGWFSGGTKKRGFEMEPGKTYISKTFKNIPEATREELLREIYPRGVPRSIYGGQAVTADDEAAVERAYQKGIERGVFK